MREEERENQAWINSHWEKEPGAEMSWDEAEYRHQNAYMLAWSRKWQLAAWPWPGGQSALASRIWHSSQAAAKRKRPSSFVETEVRAILWFQAPSQSRIGEGWGHLRVPTMGRAELDYGTEHQAGKTTLRKEHTPLSTPTPTSEGGGSSGKWGLLWRQEWQKWVRLYRQSAPRNVPSDDSHSEFGV